jgi:hypothetical protein
MPNKDYFGLSSSELLEKAFAGWSFNGFEFPALPQGRFADRDDEKQQGKAKAKDDAKNRGATDGCTGDKCISKASKYYLRRRHNNQWQAVDDETIGLLSAHLYFKASCGELKPSTKKVTLSLNEFHLTMRRSKSQFVIDANGPSILTSKESIHINRNTDWGRSENIDALVNALANDLPADDRFTRAELLDYLAYKRLTTALMTTLAVDLKIEAPKLLTAQLQVDVEVETDASIEGRR